MTDRPPAPAAAGPAPRLSDTCIDCGATLALCDHALMRIVSPVEAYHTKVEDEIRADLVRTRAEAEAFRTALEWYADRANYDGDHAPGRSGFIFEWSFDEGERARQALAAPTPQQQADDARHPFIPLSGSQDQEGRYMKCGVDGCTAGPDQHGAAAPSTEDEQP